MQNSRLIIAAKRKTNMQKNINPNNNVKYSLKGYLLIVFIILMPELKAITPTDSIIFRALEDEIERNIIELSKKTNEPPFYISFTLQDVQTLTVSASFGAIIDSDLKKYRSWSNRVLCGNYKLNDENYYDATRTKANRDETLSLPIEDDYWGIRRALWSIINNTYKSAAQTYQNKLAALKEKNIDPATLEIADFAEAPKVELIKLSNPVINQKYAEELVRTSSAEFLKYPEVSYCFSSYYQIHANLYFYSTEKTKILIPIDYIMLSISALAEDTDGENISDMITFHGQSTEQLPGIGELVNHVQEIIKNLNTKKQAKYLKENYIGPVLFLSEAAGEAWIQGLIANSDNLIAYREPLYNTSQMSLYYGQNMNSLEAKIGKQIINKHISIYDIPKLNTWKNIPLIGSYLVDAEGVIPDDTLTLIENGILRTLYNGRTPSRSVEKSNGHRRYIFQNGVITSDVGPGVMFIRSNITYSLDQLKQKLILLAKEQGHDIAFIVKPISKTNLIQSNLCIYQVNLETGEETMIRGAILKPLNINHFRKDVFVSNSDNVTNTFINDNLLNIDGISGLGQNYVPDGVPVSVICPSGLLLDDVEITYYNKAISRDKPLVPRPEKN